MGGFLYNGCGARDYFTKVKYLGDHLCPNCNRMAPFHLEKGDYKIAVLWIPTVTLKERYAVLCEKCKEGVFVEQADVNSILNGNMSVPDVMNKLTEVQATQQCPQCGAELDGEFCGECGAKYTDFAKVPPVGNDVVKICASCGSEVEGVFCSKCGTKYAVSMIENPVTIVEEPEPTKICANCGAEVNDAFCSKCGTKYIVPELVVDVHPVEEVVPVKICASCGAEVEGSFCGKCGTKYQHISEPPKEEHPELTKVGSTEEAIPQEWECSLCGTKNPKDSNKCSLCGCEKQ